MSRIVKRIGILGILVFAIGFFALTTESETVAAATCYQVCEAERGMCDDSCVDDCSTHGEDCQACIFQCATYYDTCMGMAIWCENNSASYTPACSINFGLYCPIINGVSDCSNSGAYNGYFQVCNTSGGGTCVACPQSNNFGCQGYLNTNPCPGYIP